MKGRTETRHSALTRWPASALAVVAALLLASCGGGSPPSASETAAQDSEAAQAAAQVAAPGGDAATAVAATRAQASNSGRIKQVVVFGDSLSDVGTYRVGVIPNVGTIGDIGGGRFTTNPSPIWADTIGLLFGAHVTPFWQGFAASSTIVGGTGYAMGGARVSQRPGYRCDPDPATGACTRQLAIPIREQIDAHLAYRGKFTANQLVLIEGGANDLFYQLGVFVYLLQNGVPIADAQTQVLAAMQQAAVDLAGEVARIAANGGKRIVVLNMPPIEDTPFGKLPDTAPLRPLIAGMVATFNGTLAAALDEAPVALLDLNGEIGRILANPGAYLVREINVPACDPVKIYVLTQGFEAEGTSLYCTRQTLVQEQAPLTYMFADTVHPTTLTHVLVARFVLVEMWKRGML